MVQKEVAEKIVSKVGDKDYGIPTVMTAFYGQAKITRIVGRQMFFPAPNVDSAILHIEIEKDKFERVDKKQFSRFVKASISFIFLKTTSSLSRGVSCKLIFHTL